MSTWLNAMLAGGKRADPRLSSGEARRMIEAGALLVDVREASELQRTGRLCGAKHVPVGLIAAQADPASPHHDADFVPSRPVLLYCASGIRSGSAAQSLRQLGYEKAFNIGGLQELVDAGLPVDRSESGR
ncbi:MAG TPA: rhodanese-like domain-containing protein [Methylomirabilota bacterium]|jgi:rhodanese-related sulfurtransferase|nr:rhodanese-like domain-containing protein [Methylomirabilota bacterium]